MISLKSISSISTLSKLIHPILKRMSSSITIRGVSVPITASCQCNLEEIIKNTNFTYWFNHIDEGLSVRSIDIQNVDYFGNLGKYDLIQTRCSKCCNTRLALEQVV